MNCLEANEKIQSLSKEIKVIKNQTEIMEMKNIITEKKKTNKQTNKKTCSMSTIIEWGLWKIKSLNLRADQ